MSPCPPRVRAPTEWAAPPSSSRTKIFAELDIAERQSLAFHLVNRQNVAPNKLWNSGDMGAWTLAVAPGDHAFQHPPDSDSALTVRVTRRAWPGSLLHFCKHASEASFRKGVSYMSIGRCSHGDMSAVPLDLHNQQTATKHGDLLHRPPGSMFTGDASLELTYAYDKTALSHRVALARYLISKGQTVKQEKIGRTALSYKFVEVAPGRYPIPDDRPNKAGQTMAITQEHKLGGRPPRILFCPHAELAPTSEAFGKCRAMVEQAGPQHSGSFYRTSDVHEHLKKRHQDHQPGGPRVPVTHPWGSSQAGTKRASSANAPDRGRRTTPAPVPSQLAGGSKQPSAQRLRSTSSRARSASKAPSEDLYGTSRPASPRRHLSGTNAMVERGRSPRSDHSGALSIRTAKSRSGHNSNTESSPAGGRLGVSGARQPSAGPSGQSGQSRSRSRSQESQIPRYMQGIEPLSDAAKKPFGNLLH